MKKKILFFTNGLYGGGAEQILLTLLTHIDYTLFNITLYSLTKDDVTKEYPEQIHYNYIFHPISDQDNCWRRITKRTGSCPTRWITAREYAYSGRSRGRRSAPS